MIRKRSTGFTLVEVLLVVVILGILALLVIPQFGHATSDARDSNIAASLSRLRHQLDLFQSQHNDQPPQTVGMWGLLTGPSDTTETAVTAGQGSAFGPYLMSAPVNPLNGQTGVSGNAGNDTASGWYYSATSNSYTLYARNADGSVNQSE
jgi:general secretion pathway protein G